jgi:hypothetical protein
MYKRTAGFGGTMVTKFDTLAINFVVKAAMAKVEATTSFKKGTDEYWEKVAEIATVAVERTQPNFTWLHRPLIHTKGSPLVRMFLPFMTVLLKTRSMASRSMTYARASAYHNDVYKNTKDKTSSEAKKNLAQARRFAGRTISIWISLLLGNMMVAFRNRKRDELRGNDPQLKDFIEDTVMGTLSMVPGIRDLWGIKDGFELTSPLIATIAEIGGSLWQIYAEATKSAKLLDEAAKKYGEDSEQYMKVLDNRNRVVLRKVKTIVGNVASFFSIPFEQMMGNVIEPALKEINEDVYFAYRQELYTDTYLKGQYLTRLFLAARDGNKKEFEKVSNILIKLKVSSKDVYNSGKGRKLDEELYTKARDMYQDIRIPYLEKGGE